jgi:hypothetical protein
MPTVKKNGKIKHLPYPQKGMKAADAAKKKKNGR